MKILITDDDPIIQYALKEQLCELGHIIVVASNGEEALNYIDTHQDIDVILIDWHMPVMDGIQLCEILRKENRIQKYIYVIMLTGRNDRESLIEALSIGADDFISKPYDPYELKIRLKCASRIVKMQSFLNNVSITDPLSKALNRRGFQRSFELEFKRSMRTCTDEEKFSYIIMDIDDFKCINDCYGHDFGDFVIEKFTHNLKENIREFDVLGRMGGEEFALLMIDTTLNDALDIAERLRASTESMSIVYEKDRINITASFGVTCAALNTDTVFEDLSKQMYKFADKALYLAKRNGKNCIKSWR